MNDNIIVDPKEVDAKARNWIDSAQDRDYCRALVNVALNLWIPQAMELVVMFTFSCNLFQSSILRWILLLKFW